MRLEVNASRSVSIRANATWNSTGITLVAGERYELRAEGRWCDMGICRDANGFASEEIFWPSRSILARFESRRRAPGERWFTRIGTVDRLRGERPELIVLEATGGYELLCVAALTAADLPVVVVNPRQVRDFAKATGQLAKTDCNDADILALHLSAGSRVQTRVRDDRSMCNSQCRSPAPTCACYRTWSFD